VESQNQIILSDFWNLAANNIIKKCVISLEDAKAYGKKTEKLWEEWRSVRRRPIFTPVVKQKRKKR